MSEESDIMCTPPELRLEAEKMSDELLPQKSKAVYLKSYSMLKAWCQTKEVEKISENVLLVYFQEQAKNKKASSLWATYSMLKSTISLKENIDISKYFKLVAFLKRQNTNYRAKKSLVFTKMEIERFVKVAPDEIFLSAKVVLVIGLAGACRTDELCKMLVKDLDVRDDIIIINIPTSKNGSSRKFVVIEPIWIEVIKKYIKQRPTPDLPKLFITFRVTKPTRQNIGHNTISKMPKVIAKYLNLPDIERYTGHSFRRTSATILAESGGDLLTLKQHGGWKSAAVAEGYIEESLASKQRIARMVQGSKDLTSIPETISQNHVSSPSTSSVTTRPMTPTPQVTCIQTEEINIPVNNLTNTASTGVFNINYNNCTINYYMNSHTSQ